MTLEKIPTNHSHHSRRSHDSHHSKRDPHPNPVTKVNTGQASVDSTTTAWLAGHLNHLTPEQEEALESFKAVCIEQQLYTPAKDEVRASHDDATLLRFLRARKFDVNAALEQFRDTEEWRKANQIDALYENIDIESYDEARKVYPQWTGRRDRRGIPIYVFVIRNLNNKNMATYTSSASSTTTSATHASSKVPPRLLRLFALYENMTRFVLPLCSQLERPNPETPIVSTTNIVDISGVGLRQFWNLKGHMQDASLLATAHYPETLDRIFIIGAPAFFPTVWGWIKRWFDPVTTSKIFILSASEVKPTLSSFMDPTCFPKQYGGELEWEWGNQPSLDAPAKELAGVLDCVGERGDADYTTGERNGYVKGPVVWHGDRMEILGSVDGKERRRTIEVPKKRTEKVIGVEVPASDAATTAAAAAATQEANSGATENEKAIAPAAEASVEATTAGKTISAS
ncbi:hypothetical protein AJ80_03827 [Polytolypa hystricis UAMH7299]|uniref:CRAL-TRIO domain-containing protein n=1 Tax=Polytolypa hystricis (strain UAMH7299) TaxID=1447883 RepID=A0A2B7YFL1_POLH7|nr:hypothetical protein AJ80_03827 [Polytolypa hystricis UAMH7299]